MIPMFLMKIGTGSLSRELLPATLWSVPKRVDRRWDSPAEADENLAA